MSERIEDLCQEADHCAWTLLRALAIEQGMTDPETFDDRDKQLLWMGIKAGTSTGVEIACHLRNS